jgi:hypothetical protein
MAENFRSCSTILALKSGNDTFGILYLSNCIQKLIFFASAPF